MSIRDMRLSIEHHGSPFPLPSEALLLGAGLSIKMLRSRYRFEFSQRKDAPQRAWYPISSSTMDTLANHRYRIELWHVVPGLAIQGTIEQAYRTSMPKAFQASLRTVNFRMKDDPDGAWDTENRGSIERVADTSLCARKKLDHEILGFERRDYLSVVGPLGMMQPSLHGALESITDLDPHGDRLGAIGLSHGLCLVDGDVLDMLRLAAPVNHGIDLSVGSTRALTGSTR